MPYPFLVPSPFFDHLECLALEDQISIEIKIYLENGVHIIKVVV
jgi:hypothetical protein